MILLMDRDGSLNLGWAGVANCSAFLHGKAWEVGPWLGDPHVAPGLARFEKGSLGGKGLLKHLWTQWGTGTQAVSRKARKYKEH